uniref:Response regulator transcription factor n=1 Tax=Thermorudis peleae TaxID=1382356 RepID=A0A831TH15_9BACT
MPEPLTKREREVLRYLAQGMTNQEIADTLHVSQGTVKAHVESIIGKLGVANRTQAVVRALELGLLVSPLE